MVGHLLGNQDLDQEILLDLGNQDLDREILLDREIRVVSFVQGDSGIQSLALLVQESLGFQS
jgi:hypothetical protein